MNLRRIRPGIARVVLLALAASAPCFGIGKPPAALPPQADFLPGPEARSTLTVATSGQPRRSLVVLTRAEAIKETGPKQTVKVFGEVYSFAPSTIVVYRDEPTEITFWNLQPDDQHDFMLMDPAWNVLMKVMIPPLKKTGFLFTFHRDGIYPFYCTMHPPAMAGQILVLPPPGGGRSKAARPQEP